MKTLIVKSVLSALPVILAFAILRWFAGTFVADDAVQTICWTSASGEEKCKLHCPNDTFSLAEMKSCHPFLGCQQIKGDVKVKHVIGSGAVKQVYLGEWKSHKVAVNKLTNTAYRDDFHHGLEMLRQLQSLLSVTQLAGVCEEKDIFVTEFYPLGSAEKFELILQGCEVSPCEPSTEQSDSVSPIEPSTQQRGSFSPTGLPAQKSDVVSPMDSTIQDSDLFSQSSSTQESDSPSPTAQQTSPFSPTVPSTRMSGGHSGAKQAKDFSQYNTLSGRFRLCAQYVKILHRLHTSPIGVRVMCDSNDINKTLSQFLLRDDFALVLNDVDALPLVDRDRGLLVKCGHRELFGDFVAPEQLWPYDDRDFDDDEMPGYDEKVDIWKIPDVCDTFIGDAEGGSKLRLRLLPVHMKCKSEVPSERPTAHEVLEVYEQVAQSLKLDIS